MSWIKKALLVLCIGILVIVILVAESAAIVGCAAIKLGHEDTVFFPPWLIFLLFVAAMGSLQLAFRFRDRLGRGPR